MITKLPIQQEFKAYSLNIYIHLYRSLLGAISLCHHDVIKCDNLNRNPEKSYCRWKYFY